MDNKQFYKSVFFLVLPMALQNLINVGISSTDVIMLGRIGEKTLSGASLGSQVFFILSLFLFGITSGGAVLIAQYWGKGDLPTIQKIFGIEMKYALLVSFVFMTATFAFANPIMHIFTNDPEAAAEGVSYLHIVCFSYVLSAITMVYLNTMRSMEHVVIATLVYLCSLITNIAANYIFIFTPLNMGIRGAAIGTFAARILELGIVLFYVWKKDTKVKLFDEKFRDGIIGKGSGTVWKTFFKVCIPILTSGLLWAVSLPMQTALLGHLSADAIAANSVSSTFFQYLKVIVIAIAGASAVVIGKDIGSNDEEKVRCNGRTLSVLYLAIGLLLGTVLFLLRSPLLSMYRLTPQATLYADHFMIIMSVIMVGMSYQMPVGVGIIQGGGDTKFSMYLNLISVWCIVMPLSFLAAFYWKLPVELVVIAVQSDQIFKCLPKFLRFKSYKWIQKLTAID